MSARHIRDPRLAGLGLIGRLGRRRDERGAMLILAAVGLVLAMIFAALAIDIGFLAADKRTDQKFADLAALDASRDLTNIQALADASVARNYVGQRDAIPTTLAELVAPDGTGNYVPSADRQVRAGDGDVAPQAVLPVRQRHHADREGRRGRRRPSPSPSSRSARPSPGWTPGSRRSTPSSARCWAA